MQLASQIVPKPISLPMSPSIMYSLTIHICFAVCLTFSVAYYVHHNAITYQHNIVYEDKVNMEITNISMWYLSHTKVYHRFIFVSQLESPQLIYPSPSVPPLTDRYVCR